jgi:hypothetical protein
METEKPKNGVFRQMTAKNRGYYLARWNGQEKVFYDGVYGTEVAAKNMAYKWYNELSVGKGELDAAKRGQQLIDWLDTQKGQWGEKGDELLAELERVVLDMFMGPGIGS